MNRLEPKKELPFALLWIAVYVVSLSVADGISLQLGTAKLITAPVTLILTAVLLAWIFKNGLAEQYGLCKIQASEKGKPASKQYLYFVPLILIASTNLWRGVVLRFSPLETVLFVASMLCVGLLEEIIFRGLLFRALCQNGVKQAILVSSVTFGFGHMVNLLNGASVFATLLQICYAFAIGFLFTILFYRSKSLIPCILTHSAMNALSAFSGETTKTYGLLVAAFLTAIALLYAVWIAKHNA